MSILSLKNICFSYDRTPVLQDISYEFEKGKMYCIAGKSGAGKTTLLSLLSLPAVRSSTKIKMLQRLISIPSVPSISVWYFRASI